MPYDPHSPGRRSIRLRGYDYTQAAAYFVTACTHERHCLFGLVEKGRVRLNGRGRVVLEEWRRTEERRETVQLDAFVVMPNHVHGIIVIVPPNLDRRAALHGYDVSVGAGTPRPDDDRTGDDSTDHDRTDNGRRGEARIDETGNTTGRGLARQAPTGEFGNPAAGSLGAIVGAFKSAVTRRINRRRGTPGASVWQRNYYERILRDEREWRACRQYIAENPRRWPRDRLFRPD